jgi:hypothetical protein
MGLDDLDDMMNALDDSDEDELEAPQAEPAAGASKPAAAKERDGIDDIEAAPSDSSSDAEPPSSSSETEEEEPLDEEAAAREAEEELRMLAMRRRGRSGVAAVATADDVTAKVQVGAGNNKFYLQQIRGWLRHRGFSHFTEAVITALEKDDSIEPAAWVDELGRLETSAQLKPFLEKAHAESMYTQAFLTHHGGCMAHVAAISACSEHSYSRVDHLDLPALTAILVSRHLVCCSHRCSHSGNSCRSTP